jgi:hypothetical protein
VGGIRIAAALLALPLSLLAEETRRPDAVFGFHVGEDRKLADWTQIVEYFQGLKASPRVLVEQVGLSTEGRPFLVVTITSEANQSRLEEIRQDNLRLADPRGLSEAEAERFVAQGKTIVSLNFGIHSTEVGSTQAAVELADLLATSKDPEILQILDKTVILMIPSQNPDGTQRVTDWYRKTLGTPFEGAEAPFLYHKYAGHDNNRDWYMFTQVESRLTVEHVFDRWRPEIVNDFHQMGSLSARIFVPPYLEPYEPNVDWALRAGVDKLGAYIAARLASEGKRGVVVHALYDAWSPSRAYPHTHGGVRILTECASARLATPVDVRFDELEAGIGYDPRKPSSNFPDPWPGGTWRLRDILDYDLAASRALLAHAAQNHEYWLRNFLQVNRRAVARTDPFAFVVPLEQKDPLATAELLRIMWRGSVEVRSAQAPFEAAGRAFPAGSHVILMSQPFSAFAKTLLEPQRYPDLRGYAEGPPQRPYDVTAHTLPLLLGVDVTAVPTAFEAPLRLVTDRGVLPGVVEGRGRSLAFGHKNGDLIALGRLLKSGITVRWATEEFEEGERLFPRGTLFVPSSARKTVEGLASELGISARGVSASPKSLILHKPRVGLYRSWIPSIDEGWTRFVFEKEAGVDYQTLDDNDLRSEGLGAFDVIVIPDQHSDEIVNGHAQGSLPDPYVGGIGTRGVKRLEEFVKAGGTLVTLNKASELPIAHFGIPVKIDVGGGASFYCPGAILKVEVNPQHAIAHGLEKASPVWFEESPAFEATPSAVVASYGSDPLLSGWLLGGERLAGKAALVEVPLGMGRVVLFGFRPQYRAQSWATYIPLLNAVYTSAATPAPDGSQGDVPAAKR